MDGHESTIFLMAASQSLHSYIQNALTSLHIVICPNRRPLGYRIKKIISFA